MKSQSKHSIQYRASILDWQQNYYHTLNMDHKQYGLKTLPTDPYKEETNHTKNIIRKLKTQIPVLSTIVDYSGRVPIQQILKLDENFISRSQLSNFEKIIADSKQRRFMDQDKSNQKDKPVSFLDYKTSHKRKTIFARKQKSNTKLTTTPSIPEALIKLKKQLITLPGINSKTVSRYQNQQQPGNSQTNQFQYDLNEQSSIDEGRLMQFYSQSKTNKRLKTETSKNSQYRKQSVYSRGKSQRERNKLSVSMEGILQELSSPEIKNSKKYCWQKQKECEKLNLKKQQIRRKYEFFNRMGQPSIKVMDLASSVNQLEERVDTGLNRQLTQQILKMDNHRYDAILKYEMLHRKQNMIKFKERDRQQKIDESKGQIIESRNQRILDHKVRLNIKGKILSESRK